MIRLRKSSILCASVLLFAPLVMNSRQFIAAAQTTPLQPEQPSGQIPRGVPPSIADMSKPEPNLDEPRKIAAAIVAADNPAPNYVVSVGSNVGAFLAVFMDKFPNARGQWTEPVDKIAAARQIYLGKYGDRINYKIGCAERDITDGCVPKGADVIITDWVTTHQNLDGLYKIYKFAYAQLPSGGWIVNLDHISFGDTAWDTLLQKAVTGFRPAHEGPPFEHPKDRTPTLEEHLGAMRAAGFDAQVVWQSFSTVLFMGRKK